MLEGFADGFVRMGWPALLHRFVLRNGVPASGRRRPKGVRMATPNQCFMNAALLCMERGYTYCEGFATAHALFGIPIEHAWAMNGGRVIDNTLQDPQEYAYLGIPFGPLELATRLRGQEMYGLLIVNEMSNIALVQERDPQLWEQVQRELEARK